MKNFSSIDEKIDVLEEIIGWKFKNRSYALRALTHRSWLGDHPDENSFNYERLEFLGDAVVDLAVAYALMIRFPDAKEGDLTKRRASLVNQKHLSERARRIGLGELLRLGRGEDLSGGREKDSILSDAMEAVIGAVFMDGGFEAALTVVEKVIEDLKDPFENDATKLQDYKSELQELTQRVYKKRPLYQRIDTNGGKGGDFIYQIKLGDKIISNGKGHTKKQAQQEAAKQALDLLKNKLELEPGDD